MGDPAGIGPEVILKALDREGPRSGTGEKWRVIGSRAVFGQEMGRLGLKLDLGCVDDSVRLARQYMMGSARTSSGRAAFEALENGVGLLKNGEISALVTAPVSKAALRRVGFHWPGQTEFLADRLGARRHAMLAWTPKLKVVFVTVHVPLAHVPRRLTPEAVLDRILLLDGFLRREAPGRKPRICCLAFNPHAFEFSHGEEGWIAEAVARARNRGIDACGPLPADAAIASTIADCRLSIAPSSRGRSRSAIVDRKSKIVDAYDGFVAMYHDQGMIPAKLLGRDLGVNVTLGLPFVRTSPLHGTAFDIAGKGIANPSSMLAAIRLARKLATQR